MTALGNLPRPQTPAMDEDEANDTDVPTEELEPADAHDRFKERYGLQNKDEVAGFLKSNGKVIGADNTERGKIETWHLRDGITVRWNTTKNRVDGFYVERNRYMMSFNRPEPEGPQYVSREELDYPPRDGGD